MLLIKYNNISRWVKDYRNRPLKYGDYAFMLWEPTGLGKLTRNGVMGFDPDTKQFTKNSSTGYTRSKKYSPNGYKFLVCDKVDIDDAVAIKWAETMYENKCWREKRHYGAGLAEPFSTIGHLYRFTETRAISSKRRSKAYYGIKTGTYQYTFGKTPERRRGKYVLDIDDMMTDSEIEIKFKLIKSFRDYFWKELAKEEKLKELQEKKRAAKKAKEKQRRERERQKKKKALARKRAAEKERAKLKREREKQKAKEALARKRERERNKAKALRVKQNANRNKTK